MKAEKWRGKIMTELASLSEAGNVRGICFGEEAADHFRARTKPGPIGATELRGQVRSQMEFGNEGEGEAENHFRARTKPGPIGATELRGQLRSQMEFGNEGEGEAENHFRARTKPGAMGATELRGQVRSQTPAEGEFGNEEAEGGEDDE